MPTPLIIIENANEIIVDASGFSGNLGPGDTDMQTVCNTVDGLSLGGSPGGSDTQIQYNNAGAFGGAAGLTWSGSSLALNTNSTMALIVEQTGVNNNTVVIDTTNGTIGLNTNVTDYRDSNSGPDKTVASIFASRVINATDKFQAIDMGTTSQSWNFIQNNSGGNRIRYAAVNAWMTTTAAGSEAGIIRFYTKPTAATVQERLRIDNNGAITIPGLIGAGMVVGGSPGAQLEINNNVTSQIVLKVKGIASQTGSLTEWQSSAGAVYSKFNATGNLFLAVKSGATQAAAGAAADEIWKTASHATLPDNVLMIGV